MASDLDLVALATELAYDVQVVGNAFAELPGYVVDRVFDDLWDNSGFYAIGLRNQDAGEIIVAIRGSEDRLDVVSDANLGVSQYLANRAPLIEYIGENILGHRVTIAGHSLGGGLSQYLGYDAALAYPAFRDKLTVHTHNGFGGIIGIKKMHGTFDPAVIEGVTFRNYRHPADPVSRIGGQAGGVFVLVVEQASPRTLLYAHANARFLRNGGPSPFERTVRGEDEAFDITQTLEELGPQLSAALRQIFNNDRPITAAIKIARLFRMVPDAERESFYSLVKEVVPFARLFRRGVETRH